MRKGRIFKCIQKVFFILVLCGTFFILAGLKKPYLFPIPKYGQDCPAFRAPNQIVCPAVNSLDFSFMKASVEYTINRSSILWSDTLFDHMMSDCSTLLQEVCLPSRPLSQEEEQFPLAFVFVVHNQREAVLSLFQSLYFPQNIYCLTYDLDASDEIKALVHILYKCLPNVVIPPSQLKVAWGFYSVLKATMNCMKELNFQKRHGWKYVQIISGNDVPIRTNLEMVRIFKIYNGAQDVDLTRGQMYRLDVKLQNQKFKNESVRIPGNLTFYKGSFASGLSRDFISFLFSHDLVQEFYKWLDGTQFPDEGLWSTVAHNEILNAPGGYPGKCLDVKNASEKRSVSRFQIWPDSVGVKCWGKWLRGSCSLGIKDIPKILQSFSLIAHKVDYQTNSLVHICVKEWVENRTYGLTEQMKNYSFYSNLPAVRYHNMKDKSKFIC